MALALWGSVTCPATPVEIVHVDGSKVSGEFVKATAEGIYLEERGRVGRDPPYFSFGDMRSMRFRAKRPRGDAHAFATTLFLAPTGTIYGTITGETEDGIVADTSIGDDLTFPLTCLAGIWFGTSRDAPKARKQFDELMADRAAGKDVLLTSLGAGVHTIRGSLASLGPEGGRFLFNRKERTFARDAVIGIVLATGTARGERWPASIWLHDGSEFAGRILAADSSGVRLETCFSDEVSVALDSVSAIQFTSDRLVFVSDLTPARDFSSGLLHAPRRPRFDRSVSNGPMSIDGRRFDRGIGVHARSILEYSLNGAFVVFAASIGIDDAVRPRGNVVFKVVGDGRTLFESGPVTGHEPVRDVLVDVTGITTLSLEVETGEQLDLSDHANWGDARLIKPAVDR